MKKGKLLRHQNPFSLSKKAKTPDQKKAKATRIPTILNPKPNNSRTGRRQTAITRRRLWGLGVIIFIN